MVSAPHGGKLVNRVASDQEGERLLEEASEMKKLKITRDLAVDVMNIAHGVYSPIEGFLLADEFQHVLDNMRLPDDTPWTIPIVLDVNEEDIAGVSEGDSLALEVNGKILAVMEIEEIYGYDKKEYARKVFKTESTEHPGVLEVYSKKDLLLGGKITLLNHLESGFERYLLWPVETRVLFQEKGWRTVVGFQTRNAPHIGHEYLQKTALTFVDGLFINPVIGKKKRGDFRDDVILEAYKVLIEHYYPKDSAVMSVLLYNMRYAGPREAIFHAIMRKNFGCTHFVVGRDHAGVGNFYGPYEAQEIFREFPDLGITPLFFKEFFYCRKCGGIVNERFCPHDESQKIRFSGTKMRKLILEGKRPPPELMRPEVVDVIMSFENPFVE